MLNPVLLTQMMRNPQAFMQQIMNNNQLMQNPIGKNAIELARKGDIQGLNSLAENLCKERGTTFEEMKAKLEKEYADVKGRGLKLDMSRGKPGISQLDISMPMLDIINSTSDMKTMLGNDTRNYGDLDGIGECRRLMAAMMSVPPVLP